MSERATQSVWVPRDAYDELVRIQRGRRGSVPVEIRNGLPVRPYVYRGLGYDQLTGGDDA